MSKIDKSKPVNHPILSIISSHNDLENLGDYVDHAVQNEPRRQLPDTMTEFYRDYVNFLVARHIGRRRDSDVASRHFCWDVDDMLAKLARLAFVNLVRGTTITESLVRRTVPLLATSPPPGRDNAVGFEFRVFNFLRSGFNDVTGCRPTEATLRFAEPAVQEYLTALYHKNQLSETIAAGSQKPVTAEMRESMRKLPLTGDVWRIAFGLMGADSANRPSMRTVLRELLKETKKVKEMPVHSVTALCVEAVYEAGNHGNLTAMLDDLARNQTLNYAEIVVGPERIRYAVGAIGFMVHACRSIYGINMSRFGVNHESVGLLAVPVNAISDVSVQVLNLSFNVLGSDGMCSLQRLLAKASQLTHLDLNGCQIGGHGLRIFSGFLMCAQLVYLRLSDNDIKDGGVEEFAKNLVFVPTLEWLDLSQNALTDRSAIAFAAASPCLKNLRSLALRRNYIGDAGAGAITRALVDLIRLTHLMLDENEIGDWGASSLADHIRRTPSLRYVNLNINRIPVAGVAGLRRAAASNGQLCLSADKQKSETIVGAAVGAPLADVEEFRWIEWMTTRMQRLAKTPS